MISSVSHRARVVFRMVRSTCFPIPQLEQLLVLYSLIQSHAANTDTRYPALAGLLLLQSKESHGDKIFDELGVLLTDT